MTSSRGIEMLGKKRVAIWGRGAEGLGMARLAMQRSSSLVFIEDHVQPGESTEKVRGDDIDIVGPEVLLSGGLDVVVYSPGVSKYRPELEVARSSGAFVTSAMSLWLEDFWDSKVLAITGTKGKSTTASLAAGVLEAGGFSVGLGGNIGKPVTDFYSGDTFDVYVVEVSSFQASEITVSPKAGVLTLIAADHLDWHGGYERYVSDKMNLFHHRRAGMKVAVNAGCDEAVAATNDLKGRVFYGALGPVSLDENLTVVIDGVPLHALDEIQLRGEHNRVNLCGAISGARLLTDDLPDEQLLGAAVSNVEPLPSRLETVARRQSVEWVDDALASNPAGTIAALDAFSSRRIVLIAGGSDRKVDFGPLIWKLTSLPQKPVLVLVGESGARLGRELYAQQAGLRTFAVDSVPEAVAMAANLVEPAGVVLFSPAAPTPAAEGSYMQRSAAFRSAIAALGS